MVRTRTELEAIIVGGGVSGIASACRLQMDFGLHNFKIFDRDATWGGTWQQNQYPGCGCDIPTRLYSLSFAQRANWDKFYSSQGEINQCGCREGCGAPFLVCFFTKTKKRQTKPRPSWKCTV